MSSTNAVAGDFWRLRERASRRWVAVAQVTLMAFDIMVCEGLNEMHLPSVELERLLIDFPVRTVLLVKDTRLFQQFVMALQLQGFMAKRKLSPYRADERSDWRK